MSSLDPKTLQNLQKNQSSHTAQLVNKFITLSGPIVILPARKNEVLIWVENWYNIWVYSNLRCKDNHGVAVNIFNTKVPGQVEDQPVSEMSH
jgi:hypothetical protein